MTARKPKRIQGGTGAGYKIPAGAVFVGQPSKWRNPIDLSDVAGQYPSLSSADAARLVVRDFEVLAKRGSLSFPNWRFSGGHRGRITWTYPPLEEIRNELAGRDLVCPCGPKHPCHADVLLRYANETAL